MQKLLSESGGQSLDGLIKEINEVHNRLKYVFYITFVSRCSI